MKYPVNTSAIHEARVYAMESIEHTADFKGWRDCYKKHSRILTGRFCQAWLLDFCRINKIPCRGDTSSYQESDSGDLTISGYVVDCKATIIPELAGQVSSVLDSKGNITQIYAFFVTNKHCTFIEPLGLISKKSYKEKCVKVEKGEEIMNTKTIQRFDFSYFIDLAHLIPLDEALAKIRENK